MSGWPFDTVLVANRGEIALRILRSVHALGLRSVAVFSDADADAPHVHAADRAVRIGPAAVASSYLDGSAILAAAATAGAGAIHPGYGFLSENAEFCRQCIDGGLVFVGPGPEAIRVMGDKRLAKQRMLEAGVPCIPGYDGVDQRPDAFVAAARELGYPVMVKASAGGGGRGMRLVHDERALRDALESAASEARNAFGDGTLYLERALEGARHVEVQVIADRHGATLHLGERDCSVQRRHQKVVEEAPSPAVDAALRARITADAVEAARAVAYENAGTVEFMLDAAGRHYFLEMNTRLQVEHPVTELVTGLDLVELQLRIAAGEALPIRQSDVHLHGHAIEVRLYAEDPANGFLPQTGTISQWIPAEAPGVRFDSGITVGQVVSPYYDPMLAKVIAHGRDREEARRRLHAAVERTVLLGIASNKDYLARVLDHESFRNGTATTTFSRTLEGEPARAAPPALPAVAACLLCWPEGLGSQAWRTSGPGQWRIRLGTQASTSLFDVRRSVEGAVEVIGADGRWQIVPMAAGENWVDLQVDAVRQRFHFQRDQRRLHLHCDGATLWFAEQLPETLKRSNATGSGTLTSPMSGRVIHVSAKPGDSLAARDCVLVVEAMKMEHQVLAGVDGVLTELHVQIGQQVQSRQLLARVTAGHAADAP